jgi:endonuclease/exonuclease/phosphatase family metal-dependent hydrolase
MKLFIRSVLPLLYTASTVLAATITGHAIAADEAGYGLPDTLPQIVVSDTLDVLTLNVAHGRNTSLNQLFVSASQHRENLKAVASTLLKSGAQVIALQEADAPSLWSGGFDHVAYLTELTDYRSFVHGYHADSWLYTYGAALLSGFALSETRSYRFRPSWPTTTKGFVRGTLLWSSDQGTTAPQPITLVSVHLDFSRESVRRAQIAELVDELQQVHTPLIVLGDFNADWFAESSPVRDLARELNLRAYNPESTGIGSYKVTERLDWILISDRLKFVDHVVLPNVVSDHLAVLAKISWDTPH